MSAAPALMELRPMGIGDILDATFRLYKAYFVPFMVIALVAYVPYALYTLVVGLSYDPVPAAMPEFTPDNPFARPPVPTGQLIAMMIGNLVFALVVLPLVQAGLTFAISSAVLGEEVTAGNAISRGKHRAVALLGTQLLMGLAVGAGFILCVVPGIIFSLWFLITAPVVILERLGGPKAMGRSRELMRDNLGKGFVLMLVVSLLGAVISGGVMTTMSMLPIPQVIVDVVVIIIQAIILPFQTAPLILLYYDLRVRKEAFDLERLAESVQGEPHVAMV